jgi:ribosomal protein S18 acetylase RimI-like enzyme
MSDPVLPSANDALLDNPIWSSLTTNHAPFAAGVGAARRYAADIGPLAGVEEPTAEAFADLAAVVPPGDVAVLFLEQRVEVPAGWELLRDGVLVQMVCRSLPTSPELAAQVAPLGAEDVAEMVALATLTEPGPFRHRTMSLGGFLGIRVGGRLAAMAGQRLRPSGFVEVSAVCTHPEFRGRGFAGALVAAVARDIAALGSVPFLTALETNTGAIRVYEQAGFRIRRRFELAVLKRKKQNI